MTNKLTDKIGVAIIDEERGIAIGFLLQARFLDEDNPLHKKLMEYIWDYARDFKRDIYQ